MAQFKQAVALLELDAMEVGVNETTTDPSGISGAESGIGSLRMRYRPRQLSLESVTNDRRWTQEQLDMHVLEMIVSGNMSLNMATSQKFGKIVLKGLGHKARGLNYPSRRKMARLIRKKFVAKVKELREILATRDCVATTG